MHCSQNFVSFCCCRHRWLNSILSSLDHDRIPESPAVFVLQEVTGTPFPVIVIFIHASGRSIRFRQARVYVRISQPPSDHGHLVFLPKSQLAIGSQVIHFMKSANQSWSSTTALQIPVQMKLYNSLAGEEVKKKKKKKNTSHNYLRKGFIYLNISIRY